MEGVIHYTDKDGVELIVRSHPGDEVKMIDREEALADCQWITDEDPEYVYDQGVCEYALANTVSDEDGDLHTEIVCARCAIGRILHERHSVPLSVLKAMDTCLSGVETDLGTTIDHPRVLAILRDQGGVELTPGALGVYRVYQKYQDTRYPYDYCLTRAALAEDRYPLNAEEDPDE